MSFLSRGTSQPQVSQEERKQQVMNEVRQQLGKSPLVLALSESIAHHFSHRTALANAQELINKMNEKCFEKCITKPGPSLSSSDEACITKCTERFLEAFNIVSKSYVTRVSKERESGGDLH
ncbi:mitochondrial import inner membrane translocase subunit tim13 [Pseudohyphozyma bogoriensis]|nr:mitochondrial import inner membrane translocase subunit tim13 [Pseudohyphozyma bogoriensis]